MSRPFILIGDRTSHGGTVISASPTSDCNGRGIARVGDKVSCPKKGHGRVTVIASGDPSALIDGQPAARHGDLTACGAMLIASQSLTTD
ncbi:PAAR domain-containing protein [Cognatazoarcus halotolerans]|uniref:PAAR domain-containing protein n=1 Tax=Cognatazoarcus halotolerans TaxID=2686016 RepID=UPI00135764A9|nr:PAAR domain-containing protein [Cognatazoarcus halotolerans]MBX3680883.1 PAAR domain-containing protein [Rhodocyclaceae bacterium]MCB1899641.1 PAAR domain-containing protein [Rhodocyclaceae bacterium]MCP5309296.1 PAAR domain-containing protein [Zoogloeaceae bacterium]